MRQTSTRVGTRLAGMFLAVGASLAAVGCHTTPPTDDDASGRSSAATTDGQRAGSNEAGNGNATSPSARPSRPSTPIDPALAAETFEFAWTTVRDTHFDPTFGGVDWEKVYVDLRPEAAAASSREELRDVLEQMLARLNQSHFVILPRDEVEDEADDETVAEVDVEASAEGITRLTTASEEVNDGGSSSTEPGTLGLDFRVVDGRALVTAVEPGSPAALAGIRPGWSIDRIDDVDVAARIARIANDSTESWRELRMMNTVAGGLESTLGQTRRLTFGNGSGGVTAMTLEAVAPSGPVAELGDLPPMRVAIETREVTTDELELASVTTAPRIGLIGFSIWMLPVVRPVHEGFDRFRDADGIVIDLRGNPGGVGAMAMGIAGHFCDEPVSLGRMRTRDGEIQFLVNPRRTSAAGVSVEPFDGPVAILVDELTGSTSEIFAGGLHSLGRVRIFGRTSMGAALPALMTRLPSGDTLLHAIADFTTSDGTRLEGRGVIPDEVVLLTQEDLLAGRDAVLLAAIEWVAHERQERQARQARQGRQSRQERGAAPSADADAPSSRTARPALSSLSNR